ncbi:MAG: PKD domain-containing protein, partial [Bacteroidia bacterium]
SATVSVLHVKIIADPDSSCSSQPLTEFTAVDVETLQPISATTFLWNFGDPPSGPANFDKNTLIKAPHNYGLGPWMTSVNIRSGPCNVTVLDTITKVGPTSTIEVPFNRVPEDQKYQCVIRDTVRFPNNSSFYHVDDVPVYEDSSAVYRYYTLSSGRKVPYWEKPLKTASIPAYGKYQGRASLITIFYLDKDTLESFTQAANDADSIIYYVNGKKVKKPVSNPIISGVDTLNIQKIKQYAFTWPGNQTKINSTKIPPGPQKHKDHALRLWTFGDNYAPKCTTDTRKNKNVKLNCNFSMDSLPIHWYTPWDQIYKYYNNGQFYGAAAEKTVLCKGGRFCYKIKYYPAMSFVIPSDTLVIVPKDATVSYGGQTITPATPEKMTGSFRIKKVPTKIVGLGTYIPTLSDEKWTFKTPNSISIKNIIAGTYATRTSGTYTMVNMRDQFELKAEHAWKTYTLSSTRPVGYDELVLNHTEPLHKEILIHKNYGSIPSKGTYQLDMNQTTRFFLAKDTIETFYQKYDDADSIIFFVNGVKVKKPLTNPINSGSDVLTITKFRVVADTAFSQFQVVITAGRTINAQPTTICVDTMIGGRDTFIQRSKIFIDSNFHRQNFYTKTAQCNTVQLYHEDTVHALRCKSTSQISLALLPPNAKGLEFKGIKCYAPPSPPYGMEFTVSKTKPGCTQRLLKFNFDSAGGKNNWTTHGGFLSPPLPGSTPWHLGYQLSGAYPTAFVQPYTAGQIQNKNPGWVTVGVIIGNGRWLDKTAPLDTIECIDTVWYHNAFRYLYLDSRFDVIAPERDQKRVCVGDTITFKLIDPIMDSVTQLVWNWNDDEGSYYEERTSYYKPYPGPSSTRNDKIIKDWKKGDKWLYSYVVRLEYDGFSYKTLDTIVTGIIRRWSIGVNFERAGDALKNAFTALGLTMSEIPSAEIPLYFGNGTGTGCIDTTGLGSLIQYGVTPYRDALTNHTVKVMIKSKVAPYKDSIAVKSKVAPYKDSIATVGFKIGDTWYRYTDFTKKDSVIISQKLHWRDSSQAGWDTLKQVNPNKYSNLKVTPGVYRHVYKKASRYFPTFQLRNTEGCFQPRNKEVDVGFFWQWTFSDSIICHGNTQVVARDSIRYFAYEDPFNWLNGRAYWRESARFLAQREFKKLDFNEHDDSIKANKFAVTGLGVPPFKWTYDDPGIYTIRIAMKDSLGCVDTARQKVYVTGVKAGFRNLSDTLKCKNIVSFFDTSRLIDPCVAAKGKPCDNIIEYTWDFGDGKQKSKLQHPSHDFTQNGYFTVRLKVRTKLGCEDSASMVVFIAGPRPYFNPENDTIICVGDSVIFNNLSHDPVYQPDWIWDFGDGQQLSSKTKASVGHRYTKPGTFQVYLTQFDDVNGTKIRCSAIYPDTSSEVVQKVLRIVKVKPVAPADFDPKDTSICPNTTITFRENSDPIYTRFSWRLGTGDTLERKKGELTRYTYTKPGIYKVIMIPDYDTPEFHKCLDTQSRIVTVMDVKAAFTIDETKT